MSRGLTGLLGLALALGPVEGAFAAGLRTGDRGEVELGQARAGAGADIVVDPVGEEPGTDVAAQGPREDASGGSAADPEPGSEQSPEPVEPAQPIEPAQPAQPVEPVEPVEPVQPVGGSMEAPAGTSTAAPSAPVTHDVPADDFELEPGVAPGGYYGHGVILERPPPDGQRQIVLGSILVPLGILAAVSSGVGVWMTVPRHCVDRMAALGSQIDDPAQCQGLFIYNVINTSYGVLMLASGATILGIGLVKRTRYRKWRARHGMRAWLSPGRHAAAGGLMLRF